MEKSIRQLVEMGATRAQAKAALKKHKDVMEAAEQIFDGRFDDVVDEDEVIDGEPASTIDDSLKRSIAVISQNGDSDEEEEITEDDGEAEDFIDYDSDVEAVQLEIADIDPYAGVFFSKDRKEEVIEVDEEPEFVTVPGFSERVRLITRGEWMKGCPEGSEQSFLFSLSEELSEGVCTCPHCGDSHVTRQKSDFFALYPEFSTYVQQLRKIVERKCRRCSKEFCLACGEAIAPEKPAHHNPLLHCANLQGVMLGIGLAMVEGVLFDEGEDGQSGSKRRKSPAADDNSNHDLAHTAMNAMKKLKKLKGAPVSSHGIGYAGDAREDTSGQQKAQAAQRAKDEKLTRLLGEVRTYLPTLNRDHRYASDYLVHPASLAHLRRRFNHVCSTFLRNDSLFSIAERSDLFSELFRWLETISNHEALASLMAQPIMVIGSVKEVNTRKSQTGSTLRERTVIYEGSAGPRELLETIVIQATAAIKSLEAQMPPEPEEIEMTEEEKRVLENDKGKSRMEEPVLSAENTKLLAFCRKILATANAIDRFLRETKGDAFINRLYASLPKLASAPAIDVHVDANISNEKTQDLYISWATQARFEYCDLSIPPTEDDASNADRTPDYKFYYNAEAKLLAFSDNPRRSLAIAKELAVLTTNLPIAWNSSVFMKVDETRVDIIKVMITGPEGTPYHNGCYLFDVFLGGSYNHSPPSVKYMTTHGGKFRFNPNLYADGKVCLSLLGTWQGPGWVPGRSTLLQVLVSIQAMILCEEPYLNEPGWAQSAGTPQSKAYSANVRRMVVKTAMLENLKNPPEPWADVIHTHFKLKAREISEQLDKWLKEDDGRAVQSDGSAYSAIDRAGIMPGGSSNGFKKDVDEMKQLLQKLQRGESIVASKTS